MPLRSIDENFSESTDRIPFNCYVSNVLNKSDAKIFIPKLIFYQKRLYLSNAFLNSTGFSIFQNANTKT